ncbi:hypothetical protein [Salinimicrobium sp. GXAS 041]|uniref:hypothetical protein n=1 Tax=Salinimicrobium sp. GXAS 041 TaxID=3400806 RepID=UPI003C749E69
MKRELVWMKYYTMNEFIVKVKSSRSTIQRFYKKHKTIGKERKQEGRNKVIPESHIKYFSLESMIENEIRLQRKLEQMSKLLECIRKGDDMQNFLWGMEWDIFGTVSYRSIMGAITCFDKMTKLYDTLKALTGDAEIKFYFTTESYDVRDGHHNHFVCFCSDKSLLPQIRLFIKKFFKSDQLDLQEYDPTDTGVFYISKQGIQGTDWDLLL